MEKYKYTGPTMLLGKYDEFKLRSGMEVLAEVNINIAKVKISVQVPFCLNPTEYEADVAAKYLEPVKPETIHFDSKKDVKEACDIIHNMMDICCKHQFAFSRRDCFKSSTYIIKDGNFEVINITCDNNDILRTVKHVYNKLQEYIKDPVKYKGEVYLNQVKKLFKPEEFADELLGDFWKFPYFVENINAGIIPREEAERIVNGDDHEVGGSHYKMAIEPWDYIHANGLGFDEGNIVKYASRHKQKNGAEDIRKIISYAKHILKTQYNEDEE